MKLTKDTNILIVGLGLLGGSYAMALTKKGYRVNALTRSQSSIDYALEQGIIAEGKTGVDPKMIGEADLIVFSIYPRVLIEWMEENHSLIRPGTILTDVTGVKGYTVYRVQELLPEGAEFISAHPMAGRECLGVKNATDEIFKNANYLVVPTESNTEEAITLCEELGRELGFARISRISVDKHDEMIAFLSQLTHAIAVTLMCCNDSPELVNYTGDSFRDLTRIAKIDDGMWNELFMCNRDELSRQMDIFSETFEKMRRALKEGDTTTMRQMMRTSTERRKLFDKPKNNEQ
ncbi:MAG: prephenate dehydrogenase [Clostridia bacterium]|nr:prephenate dehydrogenase [Clostridia bacterium]